MIFLPRFFTNLSRHFIDRFENRTMDEVVEISKGSDLVGISLMTNYFDNGVQITQRIKKDLNIPVMWGGIHPTIRPEECLDHADIACLGEGEESVVELVRKMKAGENYHDVLGMCSKNQGKPIINGTRPLPQDLDSIPFADYAFSKHFVLDNNKTIRPMDAELLQKYGDKTYTTMCIRGCPFVCTYCCNNTFNTLYPKEKRVRKRSIDNIISELLQVKNLWPSLETIRFDDDEFFVYTVEEIREFSEKYKAMIGVPLSIPGITPATMTREKLAPLVDAGLKYVRIGVQSGSERALKLYKRPCTNKQVEKAATIINEFKDKLDPPAFDIILDSPWEDDNDLVETLMLLTSLPAPFFLSLFSLTFYPATYLYDKAKSEGLIKNDLEDVYRKFYYGCKKTYLNGLFFLLNEYTVRGHRISPEMMRLLTSKSLIKLRINWLLYYMLKLQLIPIVIIHRVSYLLRGAVNDLKKGDWHRIIRFFTKQRHAAYSTE